MIAHRLARTSALLAALAFIAPAAAQTASALDIKQAVPQDVHLAVYAPHNAERDYQREYFLDAWKTFRDEKIAERFFKIVTSKAPKDKLQDLEDGWAEVKEALEPIQTEALLNAEECVFAQKLDGPVNHFLAVIRLNSEDAADYEQGLGQLFDLVEKWSEGEVRAEWADDDGVKSTVLALPKEAPIQPIVAQIDDLFIVSTSKTMVDQAVAQLRDDEAESKFDDERLTAALEQLPKPEDALVFLDGKALFAGLHQVPEFIRAEIAKKEEDDDGKEKALRVVDVMNEVIRECEIIDYMVTVEYTDGYQNRTAALGKLTDDADQRLLGKAVSNGQPFEDWQSWIPAEATGYSLNTGVDLHVLYEGVIGLVRNKFPEAEEALAKWESIQEEVGVDVDKDILQSFSGETVSFTMPAGESSAQKFESVTALKCNNPERVRELLERAVEGLGKFPALAAQKIELEESDDIDGFLELKAGFLQMSGAKPVFGFHDGWMIMASSPDAAQTLIDVRAGDAESIAKSETFEKFNLEVDGEVYAASYSDIGKGIRQAADTVDQIGAMAPAMLMMVASEAKPEDIKLINEAIGLLPSVAKVIRKFDFFEDRLSITREGPMPHTFLTEAVTIVRQPAEDEDEE